MSENSEVLAGTTVLIFPLIVLFGLYVTVNGHITPGGGFQGGAILAAVFMSRYLIFEKQDIQLSGMRNVEKWIYLLIVLLPVGFLFTLANLTWPFLNEIYLIVMNGLIAIKVFCGLSIVFFRFIFYESEKT